MSDYQISKDSNYLLMVDPIYEKFFDKCICKLSKNLPKDKTKGQK